MPLNPQLLADIQATLATLSRQYSSRARNSDIYELWVLSQVCAAARDRGATVRFLDGHGNPVRHLFVRTSPGQIFGPGANFSHALIEFPNSPPLEGHIGIYVEGRSRVVHECDVAVLSQADANHCRQNSVHPVRSKLELGVECKYYSSRLGLDLGRSFLGLSEEMKVGSMGFASNAQSNSLDRIFKTHRLNWWHDLDPSNPTEIAQLRAWSSEIFKRYMI